MKRFESPADNRTVTRNDRSTKGMKKRTDPTPEHKGYNEKNPTQPEGAFMADVQKKPATGSKQEVDKIRDRRKKNNE